MFLNAHGRNSVQNSYTFNISMRKYTETPKGNTFFHVKHSCISDGSFLLAYDVSFG
jgi:hypothetical protein